MSNRCAPLTPLRLSSAQSDADTLASARLLGSVGPLLRSAAQQRRVWRGLQNAAARRASHPARALRWAPALVLLVATAASAGVGQYWVRQGAPTPTATPPAVAPIAQEVQELQIIVETDVVAPAPRATPKPRSSTPPRHPRPDPVAPAAALPTAGPPAPPGSETELLLQALQARNQGRADRVDQLVARYRAKYPAGALGEEALGLAIEASVATGNGRSRALASEYLQRFPKGRFAAVARRALELPAQ